MHLHESVGRFVGFAFSPVTRVVAMVRQARVFHPEGYVFRAKVVAAPTHQDQEVIADRISQGEALLRFSTALWRHQREWIDALGIGMRLCQDATQAVTPKEHDQDLLFATIRSPWTTLIAPFSTQFHDFTANDYYAVSPFHVAGLGLVKWRLVSSKPTLSSHRRSEKIREAVAGGVARFELQQRPLFFRRPWSTVAKLELLEEVSLDQEALRFWPWRSGRGIEPRGFVHALRKWTYASSQAARPKHRQTSPFLGSLVPTAPRAPLRGPFPLIPGLVRRKFCRAIRWQCCVDEDGVLV